MGILTATRDKHCPALHNINITLPENIFVTEKLSLINSVCPNYRGWSFGRVSVLEVGFSRREFSGHPKKRKNRKSQCPLFSVSKTMRIFRFKHESHRLFRLFVLLAAWRIKCRKRPPLCMAWHGMAWSSCDDTATAATTLMNETNDLGRAYMIRKPHRNIFKKLILN